MIAQLLFFAVLTCLFFFLLLSVLPRYYAPKPKTCTYPSLLVVVFLLSLALIGSASGLVLTTYNIYKNNEPDTDPAPTESIPQPTDPTPDFPTSPPISREEDLFPPFRLSAVKNSMMLTLDEALIGNVSIDADQLVIAADERFGTYIAQYCRPTSFFPFYPSLSTFFPIGEEVNYSFDSVSSVDDCNAQLRGIGKCLEQYKLTGSLERIGETCHNLAIRSRDALNFTKYKGTEDQPNCSIWLYSEISFSALMNEYIYSRPEGLALSNWYYRTAQVFDYLGGIADTEELELRMYFLSAVFLRCSFETLKEQGLQVYPGAYDCEIWTLYMEMLYRVSTHMDSARAEGFYLEIQRIETAVLQQPLPDTAIASTTKTLSSLVLYQEWRERYG